MTIDKAKTLIGQIANSVFINPLIDKSNVLIGPKHAEAANVVLAELKRLEDAVNGYHNREIEALKRMAKGRADSTYPPQ